MTMRCQSSVMLLPRFVGPRDAPHYLGMDRNRFNSEVRPSLTEVPIGTQEVAVGTINHGLKIVQRILNLAAGEWIDADGLTWLANAPKFRLLPDLNKRQPYPLDWDE